MGLAFSPVSSHSIAPLADAALAADPDARQQGPSAKVRLANLNVQRPQAGHALPELLAAPAPAPIPSNPLSVRDAARETSGHIPPTGWPKLPKSITKKKYKYSCAPAPSIPKFLKHTNLGKVCYEIFRPKHTNLDAACGKAFKPPKHANLGTKCLTQRVMKHKSMDKYNCGAPVVCHKPMKAYEVNCQQVQYRITTLERVGMEIKYVFTNHYKHCKINRIYSGVSGGQMIDVKDYGLGVVVDFVVKDRVIQLVKYVNGDSTKPKITKKKVPTVKHIIVLVINPKKPQKASGEANFKKIKLSVDETKQVMVMNLAKQKNFVWLFRLYPEERANAFQIMAKYAPDMVKGQPVPYATPAP